jgi:hypothetical protein
MASISTRKSALISPLTCTSVLAVLAFAAETRQRAADLRAELDADRHAVHGHVVVATVEGMLTRFVPDAIGALAVRPSWPRALWSGCR